MVDFNDLILYVIQILTQSPDIRKKYQNQFKYILVDEVQDLNLSQEKWLKVLIGNENDETGNRRVRHLTCVGDDDQMIYGWRGATG